MENLNAEQIINEIQSFIKALKDCGGWVKRGNGEGWFNHEILADALALINSQEQRIKELTEENERLRAENVDCQLGFRLLEDAFERLEKINEQTEAETRAETVGQMQERLKERFSTATRYSKYSGAGVVMVIDQIAKEMVEGEK